MRKVPLKDSLHVVLACHFAGKQVSGHYRKVTLSDVTTLLDTLKCHVVGMIDNVTGHIEMSRCLEDVITFLDIIEMSRFWDD